MRTPFTGQGHARGSLGVALACVPVLAACGDTELSAQFDVGNDTGSVVIVQFDGTPAAPDTQAFEVPPGSRVRITLDQGPKWRGRVAVLDADCAALFDEQVDTFGGSLRIGGDAYVDWFPDALPALGPDETRPPDALNTDRCGR